jgi:hypothetical protein
MNSKWSLPELFSDLHLKIHGELQTDRILGHPTDKGDASEQVWIDILTRYLPRRYEVRKGFVVDSRGNFSDQIDLIVHDRQYSPFVFRFKETDVVPAESVYAIFEAKQELNSEHIAYAGKKAASVRGLHRTSLEAVTISGLAPAKKLHHILAGILTLTTPWRPPMGQTLVSCLAGQTGDSVIDIGCIADSGVFNRNGDHFEVIGIHKPATRFLFELIAQLQAIGTAPMLDVRAYAAMI